MMSERVKLTDDELREFCEVVGIIQSDPEDVVEAAQALGRACHRGTRAYGRSYLECLPRGPQAPRPGGRWRP